ncbi:hypothetical protein Dimus_009069 [Dionaea muscipula]
MGLRALHSAPQRSSRSSKIQAEARIAAEGFLENEGTRVEEEVEGRAVGTVEGSQGGARSSPVAKVTGGAANKLSKMYSLLFRSGEAVDCSSALTVISQNQKGALREVYKKKK